MQEEVENRTVTLAVRSAKLTGDVLKQAISKYLAYRKEKTKGKAALSVKPSGKQTVKELVGQNQGVSNIEVTEKNIKGFDKASKAAMIKYNWPGNIRELRNIVERLIILAGNEITEQDIHDFA